MSIDPRAIIEDGARLGRGVEIGPYAIIGKHAVIGDSVRIGAFTVLEGRTTLAKGVTIGHHAVLGTPPQDVAYRDEKTSVEIGEDTVVREFATIHRATGEGCSTRIGKSCFLMAYCHIAHNCRVGNAVTMANGASLSGYVVVEDMATLSGLVGVHQFVRIGRMAMVGGLSKVVKDIPPFSLADGHTARLYGLNLVGMKRRKMTKEEREEIKKTYVLIRKQGIPENVHDLNGEWSTLGTLGLEIVQFYLESKRGVTRFSLENKSLSDVC